MKKAQTRFQTPFILLACFLAQYTTYTPVHDNLGHPAIIQCGLCSKRGLGKALWGFQIRLVHWAWVGLRKGSQRMQGSSPGGRALEITKSFKYSIVFNPRDNSEEGFLWLHFTNEKTLRRSFSVKGKGRGTEVYLTPAPRHSAFLRASLLEGPSLVLVCRIAHLTRIQALACCSSLQHEYRHSDRKKPFAGGVHTGDPIDPQLDKSISLAQQSPHSALSLSRAGPGHAGLWMS